VPLTIVNWNVYSHNRRLSEVRDAILNIHNPKPDIICLQEVPDSLLDTLHALDGYRMITAEDYCERENGKKYMYYIATLSRCHTETERVFSYKKTLLRSFVTWAGNLEEGKQFLYIDILYNGVPLRIFNVHLNAFAKSQRRLRQFRMVCRRRSNKKRNIMCGDFNISDRWLVGKLRLLDEFAVTGRISFKDLRIQEYEAFAHRLQIMGSKSVFKNCVTRPSWLVDLQLDDVVVPQEVKVREVYVHKENLYGSDHCLLRVQLEIPAT